MSCRWFTRVLALFLFAAYASLAAHAYDAIVVFGDSYNDVGNIHIIAGNLGVDYPPAPYYDGRFSNGPIWVEHVASSWSLPMLPSLVPGGTDYAVGGAELLQAVTLDGALTIPSIEDQVAYYLATHGGHADPKALYIIEGGGNDIIGLTDLSEANAVKLGGNIASGLVGIVATLEAAGAKSFLVPDLLDVGQLPVTLVEPAFSLFADEASAAANAGLNLQLAAYPRTGGVTIFRIPVFHTFLDVAKAKAHFGFTNVTTPCVLTSGLTVVSECADPDHSLWWDAEHPSEFAHGFFAVLVESAIPE